MAGIAEVERPHIAVICRELGGEGSVAAVALRQARELARYARVTLLSDSIPAAEIPGLALEPVSQPEFRFLRRFAHVPRECVFASNARRRLFELQEQGAKFDFVLCHAHSLVVIAAVRFRGRHKVPCGLVSHGDVWSSPPGTYDWLVTRFWRWAIPRACARADLVVALSPYMLERAIACGANSLRVELIPNGIEAREIGLEAPGDNTLPVAGECAAAGQERLKVLFVGTLEKRKGIDLLVRAVKSLKDGNVPVTLRIVGDGPLRGELDQFVAANDLSAQIELRGAIRRADLGSWYRWADVACVPSRDDPLPTVVLESLLAGTPVVGSAIGGIGFMVQAEVNGLLVPPEDSGALAAALERIHRQRDFLARLKLASAPSVKENFSWGQNGEKLIRAIARLARAGET